MSTINFNIFSNGLSASLAATSPYHAAKIIADKLAIDRDKINSIGGNLYLIGGHSFHISM